MDLYKELSKTLIELFELLEKFYKTKDDYLKPEIRAFMQNALKCSKSIEGEILKNTLTLSKNIEDYLIEPKEVLFIQIKKNLFDLKNELWAL